MYRIRLKQVLKAQESCMIKWLRCLQQLHHTASSSSVHTYIVSQGITIICEEERIWVWYKDGFSQYTSAITFQSRHLRKVEVKRNLSGQNFGQYFWLSAYPGKEICTVTDLQYFMGVANGLARYSGILKEKDQKTNSKEMWGRGMCLDLYEWTQNMRISVSLIMFIKGQSRQRKPSLIRGTGWLVLYTSVSLLFSVLLSYMPCHLSQFLISVSSLAFISLNIFSITFSGVPVVLFLLSF